MPPKPLCRMLHLFKVSALFAFIISLQPAKAQDAPSASVKAIVDQVDTYHTRFPSEKLYLQTDKPYYFAGDTIWFKACLVNAGNRTPSFISAKLYVEVINDTSRVIDRIVIPLTAGLGEGDITLYPKLYHNGAYTIRAYTNWMQNFGEEAYFHKRFNIGNNADNTWLISEQHSVRNTAEGKAVDLALQLSDMKNMAVPYSKVQVQVTNGTKTLYRETLMTGDDGKLSTKWLLPKTIDTRNLNIIVQDADSKKHRQSFPFYIGSDAQNIDLQFMPEGGDLVAGLLNKVAFKAIGDNGLGMNISGVVVDSKDNEVAVIKTAQHGMGSFRLVPALNESYRAKIRYGATDKTVALPQVKSTGVVMRVDNISNADTLKVYMSTGQQIASANKEFTLLAQAKDTVYFSSAVRLTKGYYNLSIPKNKFATGIVNFTLLDKENRPLNQRKVFIDHHDKLTINTLTNKPGYHPKDSVAVDVTVVNYEGKPVQGSFSVSVTDDAQVKTKPTDGNIISSMLFTSELKGNIEEPGWYFTPGNTAATKAIDDLLLTQGWTGFDWADVMKPKAEPVFKPEPDNRLSGRLINFFKKPVAGAKVTLALSNKDAMTIMDTISGKDGRFLFSNIPHMDSVAYTVKVHKAKGGSFSGGIEIDEVKTAGTMPVDPTRLMPWYVYADSTLITYREKNADNRKAMARISAGEVKGTLLNEVTIKAKKKINVKGFRGEDINYYDALIEEIDLQKQGRLTLYDYLEKNVKDFRTVAFYRGNRNDLFFMKGNIMIDIYVDGINVNRFYSYLPAPNHHYNYLKSHLTGLLAADVKQMVLYHTYVPMGQKGDFFTILVITTRNGSGPVLGTSPGTYVYRPEPVYQPRRFYTPKYTVNNAFDALLSRSTIHWEPNLITNKNGKATLWFYAGDKPSVYNVIIEGTDMAGHFGSRALKIRIDNKAVN